MAAQIRFYRQNIGKMFTFYREYSNGIRRFVAVALILLVASSAGAVNLDRLFPQTVDESFFAELRQNEGSERAVFVTLADQEKVFYLRYDNGTFVLRGNLTHSDEKLLAPVVTSSRPTVFSPLKQNGEPLYRKGTVYTGSLFCKEASGIEYLYVPHLVGGRTNDAFVCDFGYLQITINRELHTDSKQLRLLLKNLKSIFKQIFAGHAKICDQVKLNQYYLYRDNYWGPVEAITDCTSDSLIFYLVHKATLNKSISDHDVKTAKDLELVTKLIAQERFLYSQDMRLKLGTVPGFVKVNWQHIDNTDIGSGQNQLVFLSTGPGINYFDDPWKQSRKNVPCPRLIFHRDMANLDKIQLYPTYSIEPEAKGVGRLTAINCFQSQNQSEPDISTTVIWSKAQFKYSILTAIEDLLCKYGLTNDSPDLTPGFELKGHFYNGNPVNNEIRISQFAAVRDYLVSVIIPANTAAAYQQEYREKLANTCRHWEYNCGIHYSKLFAEAVESTDKGFRASWLIMQLKESHPTLFRILAEARKQANAKAFIKIADKISQIASREGRDFFLTPYFRHYRTLDQQRNQLWLSYLEACRSDEKNAEELFSKYIDFYRYLEGTCE
ncbi:MAG: hypothetical protein KKB51_04095 [Candidatus Riflebacteria bacterium]|nr:hypothetical protein [Candidatus Riflebacteria bacterium]